MLTVFCCQVLIIWWIGSNRTLFLVPDFCCLICLVYSEVLCNVSCAMSGPCFKDDCIVIYIRDGERIGQRRMEGTTGLWRNSLWFSHLCTKSEWWLNLLLNVYTYWWKYHGHFSIYSSLLMTNYTPANEV